MFAIVFLWKKLIIKELKQVLKLFYYICFFYSDADAKKLKTLPYIAADPYSFGKEEARLWIGEEHDTFRMKSFRMSGEDMLKVALFSLMNTKIDSVRFCNYKQKLRSQQPLSKSYAEHINELWTNTVFADEYAERMAPMSPEDIDALTLDEMRRLSEDYRSNFNGMHFAIESNYQLSRHVAFEIRSCCCTRYSSYALQE